LETAASPAETANASFCLEHLYNYELNLASGFGMKSEIHSLTVQVKE
jgi:hypothetical protein